MARRRVTRTSRPSRTGAGSRRALNGRGGRTSVLEPRRSAAASTTRAGSGSWFPLTEQEEMMASTSTTTANGTSEQALDRAIERIETLYRTVTGRDVPPLGERESGAIPPERDPEQHVGDQIDPRVPDEDDTHHQLRHAEPWQGLFRRTLPIPPDAEVDRLEAQMIDGVLDIRVPRRQTARQGRDVPVS